jgi:hypothetical protein
LSTGGPGYRALWCCQAPPFWFTGFCFCSWGFGGEPQGALPMSAPCWHFFHPPFPTGHAVLLALLAAALPHSGNKPFNGPCELGGEGALFSFPMHQYLMWPAQTHILCARSGYRHAKRIFFL